jgi:hypothetical protein
MLAGAQVPSADMVLRQLQQWEHFQLSAARWADLVQSCLGSVGLCSRTGLPAMTASALSAQAAVAAAEDLRAVAAEGRVTALQAASTEAPEEEQAQPERAAWWPCLICLSQPQ